MSVYAPIAHRLGISEIKNELEDLSFKYLDYKKYEEIKGLVKQRESDRNGQVQEMISDIESILQEYNIQYRILAVLNISTASIKRWLQKTSVLKKF